MCKPVPTSIKPSPMLRDSFSPGISQATTITTTRTPAVAIVSFPPQTRSSLNQNFIGHRLTTNHESSHDMEDHFWSTTYTTIISVRVIGDINTYWVKYFGLAHEKSLRGKSVGMKSPRYYNTVISSITRTEVIHHLHGHLPLKYNPTSCVAHSSHSTSVAYLLCSVNTCRDLLRPNPLHRVTMLQLTLS